MDNSSDSDHAVISYSNVAAIGVGVALVVARAICSNYKVIRDNMSSLMIDESIGTTDNIDWNCLTIPAETQGCSQARVFSKLAGRPLVTTGKSERDGRKFQTIYEGFKIGKEIAKKIGDGKCLGYRQNRESPYEWLSYDQVEQGTIEIGSGLIHIGENFGQKTFKNAMLGQVTYTPPSVASFNALENLSSLNQTSPSVNSIITSSTSTSGATFNKLTGHLNDPSQKQQIRQILNNHAQIFDISKITQARTNIRHPINTGDSLPISSCPYPKTIQQRREMQEEIQKMMQNG
ncbi:unnamed protein product [Didymodactylos carnosus]|uniref:Uncharacterized protein n=1 Tax=Didymodactylos carnosus TaxID=1234261 RepID=A0A815YN63_9BILA|nr:unnamed protein product [Didymodactylos carnosus]CAF4436618.1 unnamed protein product [Didymodactylos carnosus]